jgi:hypothetical protein
MISHQEAEILTSARQDAPLDPVVERELQAHLATCDQCRAFAAATERLTAGLRSLPTTPASPRVRREVMEQVNAGRNPLVALLTGNSSASFGTTLSTLAAVLLIGVIGWFALDRLYFDSNNGNENNQIAAVPTEVPANVFNATSTLEATDAPVPTATSETKATEIPSPTVTSEPTATTPPTPTATLVPTSTTAPTATSASTEVPVDLTVPQETAAVRSAKEPTATATEKATVAPTTVPPTQTPAPTQTPEPTQTQAIEPIDGSTTNAEDETATSESERTTAASTGEAGENNPGIELIDPGDGTEGAVEDVPNETTNADAIEPIGSDEEATPGVGGSGDTALVEADQSEAGTTSLMDASVSYNMIDGDPSNHLGLTAEGRMIFTNVPDGATFTTSDGYTMRSADSQPGVVEICTDSYCEPALETPEDGSWQQDVPMGVSGTTAYVLRIYSDRSEVIVGTHKGRRSWIPRWCWTLVRHLRRLHLTTAMAPSMPGYPVASG